MKQTTATYKKTKECKHSIVFANDSIEAPASSIYVNKRIIPIGATELKLTVSFPAGGADQGYNNI